MPESAATAFRGKYLSVTTYKRDGTAVSTPVWFVEDNGRLLAQTEATSGKVKRIRANPSVRVAICTVSGRLRSASVSAHAEVVEDEESLQHIEHLLKQKYRFETLVIGQFRWCQKTFHLGRQRGAMVGLAITPD